MITFKAFLVLGNGSLEVTYFSWTFFLSIIDRRVFAWFSAHFLAFYFCMPRENVSCLAKYQTFTDKSMNVLISFLNFVLFVTNMRWGWKIWCSNRRTFFSTLASNKNKVGFETKPSSFWNVMKLLVVIQNEQKILKFYFWCRF